jgi:hypothetical protein
MLDPNSAHKNISYFCKYRSCMVCGIFHLPSAQSNFLVSRTISLHDIYYFVLGGLNCNKYDCLYSSSICKLPVIGSFDIIGLLWCFHQIGFFSFRSCTWAFGYRKKGLSPFGWTKTVQAEYEGKNSYIGHYYQASYGCSLQV